MNRNKFQMIFDYLYLILFQIELEKLNNATDDINKLETELDVSKTCGLLFMLINLWIILAMILFMLILGFINWGFVWQIM